MENKKVNEAIFRARIASLRGNNENGSIVIACPTITTMKRNNKFENGVKTNFPVLSYNKNTVTKNISDSFKVGDYVVIKGYVQPYIHMNELTGEVMDSMNLYIREIAHDNSKMMNAFGMEGKYYPESQNDVYLSGPVVGITRHANSSVHIRIDLSTERKCMIDATYLHAPEKSIKGIAIGDTVSVVATVQTVDLKSEEPKERRRARNYQELIILDFATTHAKD